MRSIRSAIEVLAIVTVAWSAPVAAAETPEREHAREEFERARRLHGAGRYDAAIVAYQAAYSYSPDPAFLFNIGQCYRLMGDAERAVIYYGRYLDEVPQGGASAEAREHVRSLRVKIALRQTWPPPPAEAPQRRVSAWRWVGAAGMATGLVLVGTGAVYGARAADSADDRHDVNRMWFFVGTGAALAISGGVTFWLARPKEPSPSLRAAPIISSEGAGVAISGRF